MKPSHISLSLFLQVSLAIALPRSQTLDPVGHEFMPASASDSRSPCPWLNALANHGYLPRDGRYITREMVEQGFSESFNFTPGTLEGPTAGALSTGLRNDGTFDLNDTVRHNVVEHDGSLSRNDVAIGNALVFDPVIWARTTSHFKSDTISVDDIARARLDRFETAQELNPAFNLTIDTLAATFTNHAVWLLSMGDRVNASVSRLFTEVIFEQERIPFNEGFIATDDAIVGGDIADMIARVQEAGIKVGMSTIPQSYT